MAKEKGNDSDNPTIINMIAWLNEESTSAARTARTEVSYSLPNKVLTTTRGTEFLIFPLTLSNPSKVKYYSGVKAV